MNESNKETLMCVIGIVLIFAMLFITIIYGIKSGNEKQIRIQEIQTYGETIEK